MGRCGNQGQSGEPCEAHAGRDEGGAHLAIAVREIAETGNGVGHAGVEIGATATVAALDYLRAFAEDAADGSSLDRFVQTVVENAGLLEGGE